MANNRFMKKYSLSLIMREMQITTTMKYHLIPVRMAIIKKTNGKYSWGCREKGRLVPSWWECKMEQLIWITI